MQIPPGDDSFSLEHSDDRQWKPPQNDNEVIERIDQTLDLIAEATSAAIGIRPVDQYDVTIIVPVYNERETLPQVLERIDQVMPTATEMIVVDDGSTDGTSEWLAELPQSRQPEHHSSPRQPWQRAPPSGWQSDTAAAA